MNKFEKNKKNYNIIIETKSAFSISIDLKIKKTWFVNLKKFQFKLK